MSIRDTETELHRGIEQHREEERDTEGQRDTERHRETERHRPREIVKEKDLMSLTNNFLLLAKLVIQLIQVKHEALSMCYLLSSISLSQYLSL